MRKIQNPKRDGTIKKRMLQIIGALLSVTLLLCVPLSATAQKNVRITLNAADISIPKALELIEKQSGYHFVYNKNIVSASDKVSVKVTNATITSTLDRLFANRGISYEIDDKYIILKSGPKSAPNKTDKTVVQKVTGFVRDSSGEPLIGATVAVKGKKRAPCRRGRRLQHRGVERRRACLFLYRIQPQRGESRGRRQGRRSA